MQHYSSLFLPKSMTPDKSWDCRIIKNVKSDDWLYGKIQVFSYEPNGKDYSHVYDNIRLYKNIINNMPPADIGNPADIHEFRVYGMVGQTRDKLPNFYDIPDIIVIKGINFHINYDIPFILASLSMNEEMYNKCKLIGWSISKFNEGNLKNRASLTFYLKGDKQILYNELKWLLINECDRYDKNLTVHDKFLLVKKCIPEDSIFYNVVYDSDKIEELIQKTTKDKFTDREKKDIQNAIIYANKHIKNQNKINILRNILL